MPTFWHYKVLTIFSVDQCASFFVLAASKVLCLHWVLAQVLDTLKACNPFVHKLSWPSTWDWLHFGNHLSCPCATCVLNLAWFDCHCYRRGMNRHRSPRVIINIKSLHFFAAEELRGIYLYIYIYNLLGNHHFLIIAVFGSLPYFRIEHERMRMEGDSLAKKQ